MYFNNKISRLRLKTPKEGLYDLPEGTDEPHKCSRTTSAPGGREMGGVFISKNHMAPTIHFMDEIYFFASFRSILELERI